MDKPMTMQAAARIPSDELETVSSGATIKRAVDRYMSDNGFTRAEYTAAKVPVKVGPITFQMPNGPARQCAIAQHDVHHVLTGYATDLKGEAEIGAWELRAGCTSAFLWAINLAAVAVGLFIAPLRVLGAFRSAKGARTLYASALKVKSVEPLTVAELRARLGVPADGYVCRAWARHVPGGEMLRQGSHTRPTQSRRSNSSFPGALAAGLIALLGSTGAASADCICPPAANTCGFGAAACATAFGDSCFFVTGCGAGVCPADTVQVDSGPCFPNIFLKSQTCRRDCPGDTFPTSCHPGYYGPQCDHCPPCFGGGTCHDGLNGDGLCTCPAGRNGPDCQFADSFTCNSHGKVAYDGSCACSAGYAGPSCNACAPNYFQYPTCTFCDVAVTCNGAAVPGASCNGAGQCDCPPEYSGAACESCAPDYYAWPTCRHCLAGATCGGRGICSAQGFCQCAAGFQGPNCDFCAPGRYGPQCLECPGGAASPCNGYGICNSGLGGTGVCTCTSGYAGVECSDPNVTSVDPAVVSAGALVTLKGHLFGNSGLLTVAGALTPVSFWSDGEIRFVAPPGGGLAPVVVIRAVDLARSAPVSLDYAAPLITTIAPATGPTAGGTLITLSGQNFGGQPTVTVGGALCPLVSANSNVVLCVTPPGHGPSLVVLTVGGKTSSRFYTYADDCPALVAPAHGLLLASNAAHAGSVATFACDPGYQLDGAGSANCLQNGNWSAPSPTCRGILCNLLVAPAHATVVYTNEGRYPATAYVMCEAGYASSVTPRECNFDGSWTGNGAGECVPVSCPGDLASCQGRYAASQADLAFRTGDLATCRADLASSRTDVDACSGALTAANVSLVSCRHALASAEQGEVALRDRVARLEGLLAAASVGNIGPGSSTGAGTVLGCASSMGQHSAVGADSFIGNGTRLGDSSTIGDQAQVGNGVRIGDRFTAGSQLTVGDGTAIGKNVTAGSRVTIGANVTVEEGAEIDDDTRIGDGTIVRSGAHVGAGATLGLSDDIGGRATVGAGARLGNQVIMRSRAVVAPGAVVPDGTVVR